MKKLWIICFMTLVGLHLAAQDIVYSTLKDLLAHKGDTVAALNITKLLVEKGGVLGVA